MLKTSKRFREIFKENPKVLERVPILSVITKNPIPVYVQGDDSKGEKIEYDFINPSRSIDQCIKFMWHTGLFDFISEQGSAVFMTMCGVLAGPDSNARKNRGGKAMEKLVGEHLEKQYETVYRQKHTRFIESKWGMDLSPITGRTTRKRFDFVVE